MPTTPEECIKAVKDKGNAGRVVCKYCASANLIKNGRKSGRQQYRCKECEHQFLDNGKYPNGQTRPEIIGAALDMYFEGLSLRKVARQLGKVFGVRIAFRSILYWIERYTQPVSAFVRVIEPKLSGALQVDETMLRIEGEWKWFWEAVDEGTRFIVATHVSKNREVRDVVEFLRKYPWSRCQKPKLVLTDGLQSYIKGIKKVFYSRLKTRRTTHKRSPGIQARHGNTNKIERVHGTLKDRTKSLRGFKRMNTAILEAYPIHYNYVRPHMALGGITPAEAAGISLPFEDGWGDLIHWSLAFDTKMLMDTDEEDYVEIDLVFDKD